MKTSSGSGFDGMVHIIAPKRRSGIDPLWSRSVYRPPPSPSRLLREEYTRSEQSRLFTQVDCFRLADHSFPILPFDSVHDDWTPSDEERMSQVGCFAQSRRFNRPTGYFFTAAFQFVTTVSGGDDAESEAFVVLIRKRLPSAVTSY
jgi:hypothetical protein